MAFNIEARQRLQRFVKEARSIIEKDFLGQMQRTFAMDPATGRMAELNDLQHLSIASYETASDLREVFCHYRAQDVKVSDTALLKRILREQTQTFLHRLCALRMAEERGVFMESLAKGTESAAFKNYSLVVGSALGGEYETYVKYLKALFDEVAGDLPQIFDRTEPFGLLFLEERSFFEFLNLLNAGDLAVFWREDETIGWIFQYFNNDEDFSSMRGQQNKNPKNSHELAVRNQFFTPRYVVEFLLDNTLGRVWAEETHGQTKLLQTCKYLVNCHPSTETATQWRDPRTLKVLDPACGSMHFGLYAFDLLYAIYEEVWDWVHEGKEGRRLVNPSNQILRDIDKLYESKEDYLAAVPSLIIQYNIYGVDIDVRATQIASLALWLRAQKAFQMQGIPGQKRPEVGEGHVVAALAPPAEKDVLSRLQQEVGSGIDLDVMFNNLRLVPETGMLLPLENDLETVVGHTEVQTNLFGERVPQEGNLFGGWEPQREVLGKVLEVYEHQTGRSFKELLYARNAAECLKLIDLCRQHYDVIVMNPPFGAPADGSREVMGSLYPTTKREIIGMFIQRAQQLLTQTGYVGAISSRTLFFQSSSEKWRDQVVYSGERMPVFLDLGPNVMDNALVESSAYVLSRCDVTARQTKKGTRQNTVFIDVTERIDKDLNLRKIVNDYRETGVGENCGDVYERTLEEFHGVPGKVFSYKMDEKIINIYCSKGYIRIDARQGLATGDNQRYVRLSCEVDPTSKKWIPLCKGGEAAPIYGDVPTCINWTNNGEEVTEESGACIRNRAYYFRPGLTWTLRANALSLRVFPKDGIFDHGGNCVFCQGNKEIDLLSLAAVINSRAYQNIMSLQLQMTTGNSRYECGMLSAAPVPVLSEENKEQLAELAKKNFCARRRLDSVNETSHAFLLPMTIQLALEHLNPNSEMTIIEESQRNMDDVVDKLYGFVSRVIPKQEKSRQVELPDEESNRNALLSWAVGVAFGRFDRRLATMEREFPEEPAPFDPYPRLSPGRVPEGDAPFIPNRGVFVMDPGHPMDLETAVHKVLDEFGLCGGVDIGTWLKKRFFPWHLKQYSAAQRTAPIYWPIGTTSGSYVLWLYYPALNDQTLYVVLNDFIDPKIKSVMLRFDEMKKNETQLDAKGRKTISELAEFLAELKLLRSQIETLAQTFTVHFDDGVAINASRFRHLIQSKDWVKKQLNGIAEVLERGEDKDGKSLDWSETAADLYPERVKALCRKNPSVALAHKNRWAMK